YGEGGRIGPDAQRDRATTPKGAPGCPDGPGPPRIGPVSATSARTHSGPRARAAVRLMATKPQSFFESVLNRRMLACTLLGFASGLSYYALVSLLPTWLKDQGFALSTLGHLNTMRTPYVWKFA